MGKSGLALVEDNIWWGIFSLIGILLFGLLGDKFSKRHLLAAAVILRCISFVVLLSVGSVQWYMNGLLFYMGAGIPVLTYAIIADYFGRRSFATIVAFSSVIRLIIMIPVVGGLWFPFRWLFEISGSYYPIIVVAVVVGILSAVLFLFLKPPQVNPQGEIVTDIP
jgi:MFS family permease